MSIQKSELDNINTQYYKFQIKLIMDRMPDYPKINMTLHCSTHRFSEVCAVNLQRWKKGYFSHSHFIVPE